MKQGRHDEEGVMKQTGRYAVVDLTTGQFYDSGDDNLDAQLESLEALKDYDDDEEDLVVVDLDTDQMCEVDNGEVIWHWLDRFSGTWRRRLA